MPTTVALLAEGVGRNGINTLAQGIFRVALLAEGVGRNRVIVKTFLSLSVALLAEGVGRNPESHPENHYRRCRPPRGGRG